MNFRTLATALVLVATSTPAFAGSWAYGCVGQLDKGRNIMFNRSELVISSSELDSSKLMKIESDDITGFNAEDINSGFKPKMVFTKSYDGKIVQTLTIHEVASKVIDSSSSEMLCTASRVRDTATEVTVKKMEVLLPDASKPITTTLKCYEHSVSACG